MNVKHSYPLPWLLGALAATMGIFALISVLVVSASADRQLFLASTQWINNPLLLSLSAMTAVAATLYFLFPTQLTALAIVLCCSTATIATLSHVNFLLNTGHAIVEYKSELYLTSFTQNSTFPPTLTYRTVRWQNQVPSLAHTTPAMFDVPPDDVLPFAHTDIRAELSYSPARSTALATFYFITTACLILWLAASPLAMFRIARPAGSIGLVFLTACPALWTALMVTTLYLLK